MKILVTGGNGQLGMSLRERQDALPGDWLFTDVEELDITDAAAVRNLVKERGIDVIVNCAGYTNVEKAEDDPTLAYRLNAEAVGNLASALKERDGLLVHISTDYVFGGEMVNTPLSEEHPAAPQGAYARSKWEGEEVVRSSGVRYLMIRTAWLYSEFGHNFVKTMLRLTHEKPSLKVVMDQVGSPTYAGDLADVIVRLLKEGREGLYHYTNEGICSWYDLAKAIAAAAGQTACDIQPCRSDEFPSKVQRPAYSVLDKRKIRQECGLKIPHWTESLQVCLGKLLQ